MRESCSTPNKEWKYLFTWRRELFDRNWSHILLSERIHNSKKRIWWLQTSEQIERRKATFNEFILLAISDGSTVVYISTWTTTNRSYILDDQKLRLLNLFSEIHCTRNPSSNIQNSGFCSNSYLLLFVDLRHFQVQFNFKSFSRAYSPP